MMKLLICVFLLVAFNFAHAEENHRRKKFAKPEGDSESGSKENVPTPSSIGSTEMSNNRVPVTIDPTKPIDERIAFWQKQLGKDYSIRYAILNNQRPPSLSQSFADDLKNYTLGDENGHVYIDPESKQIMAANPLTGFVYKNITYYWGLNYMTASNDLPIICVYPQEANKTEFGDVFLPDNVPVTEIVFGCGAKMSCYFYECQSSSGGFWGWMFIIFAFLAIIWAFTCCACCNLFG